MQNPHPQILEIQNPIHLYFLVKNTSKIVYRDVMEL